MEPISINVTLYNSSGECCVSDGLIFALDDVKRLRQLGICGVLCGTLPTLAQQNVFLSVPLRLSGEEVLWLLANGYGKLNVTDSSTVQTLLRSGSVRDEVADESLKQMGESFELQTATKQQEYAAKRLQFGITGESNSAPRIEPKSLFQEIPNESAILRRNRTTQDRAVKMLYEQHGAKLALFSHLKEHDFVISPGARFGGKYIIYPGDPLRFHSHLIVSDTIDYYRDPVDFSSIIDGARLATSVKKTWVINGNKGGNDVKLFSVEWAGFG